VKYVDEFRDGRRAQALLAEIRRAVTRRWVLMEVCGGQTHSILRYGLDTLLPEAIELVHGPGCPVCVTPLEMIDRAHAIAERPGVLFTSFGDMLRVPGSRSSLLDARARGADVRVVYSPLDALRLARENPDRPVVFFAVGFETTAPANAMAVARARADGVTNFSVLVSHVLVPPAMAAILSSPGNRVDAYLGPGHVAAVVGCREYDALAARFHVPIVITGFEPVDILEGVLLAVRQLEAGRAEVENQYARAVRQDGNLAAQRLVDEVFEVCDRRWRGVGTIPQSGLTLRAAYRAHDAERLFDTASVVAEEPRVCISGLVLTGQKRPGDCPAFGTQCTPERPLGATMVSSEGACAAYFAYRRRLPQLGASDER
jgi:hydrogenase expression/formation protein HypD